MRILICDSEATRLENLAQNLPGYEIITATSGQECLNAGPVTAAFISENIQDIMWDNLVAALSGHGASVYVMGEMNLELLQAVIQAGGKGVVKPDPEEIARILKRLSPVQSQQKQQNNKRPLRGRLDRNTATTPQQPALLKTNGVNNNKPTIHVSNSRQDAIIHNNKLIVFYAYKGGVGKTLLSAATAIALANNPHTRQHVCIVDFDPYNGDIGKLFSIQPKCSILDWLSKDTEDLKDYLVDHPSGVKILPGPRSPLDGISIGKQEASRILSVLTRRFDAVIVDTTHMPRDSVIVAIENASKVFIIGTPNRITLQDNTNIAETFRNAQIDVSNFNLIVNMMPKKQPLRLSDYKPHLPWDISLIIPDDPAIERVINSGNIPVLDRRPKSFNQSIKQLANLIMPVYAEKKGFTLPKLFSKRAVN